MFTSNKPKPYCAPRAKQFNSGHHFTEALNRSFDTAEKLLSTNKNLKQTKLCFSGLPKRQKYNEDYGSNTNLSSRETKHEFFLMPIPKPISSHAAPQCNLNKSTVVQPSHSARVQNTVISPVELDNKDASSLNLNCNDSELMRGRRGALVLLGRVDFCLKMHKVHPEVEGLWDVYGQLKKINKGKLRGENILLLRNVDGGPILQSIYYDFDGRLNEFPAGSFVRAVGRFIGENRLHTYKLEKVHDDTFNHFTRIQNVESFVLLQQKAQQNNNKK